MNRVLTGRRSDDGFTLTELLVSMAIFAIVIAIVFVTISTFEQNLSSQTGTDVAMNNTEIAAESFTQYLRAAQSVTYASPTEITFVADAGYDSTTDSVDETTVDASVVSSSEDGTPSDLLHISVGSHQTFIGQVLVSGTSPFTYCAYTNGAPLTASSDPQCPPAGDPNDPLSVLSPSSGSLTASELGQVSIVHVDFEFVSNARQPSSNGFGLPVIFDTQVSLQNELPNSIAS